MPGAWLGSSAGGDGMHHITIDPKRTIEALAYLRRKRVQLIAARMSEGCPGGLLIDFRPTADSAD